jgi:signal transduction histidine kinase
MMVIMRNADSPYLADLFAISLRWLALFGLAISLGTSGYLSQDSGTSTIPLTLIILSLPALWNGFVSALAILNRRLALHRLINVSLDFIFSMTLFITAGGLVGGMSWVSLLPLFSSAIYFEARGALLIAILASAFQMGYTYLFVTQELSPVLIGVIVGFNMTIGIIVAVLSAPLMNRLRRSYQLTMSQRKEGERKAQRMERDRMRALFSMIETFSSTLNYQTVLDTVLDTALSASGETERKMICGVLLFEDQQDLKFRASRGISPVDQNVSLSADQGALRETLKTGEAHLVENPGEDSELGKLLAIKDRKVALCLPLIRGMNAFGVMIFAHANPDFFTPERAETLQMLCNQAIISIQNARLYQDLAREKERIVQTQEEAQKKLARDLHDGPTQSVSAIAMRVNIARMILERNPKEASDELLRIEELARRTTQEIRHMLFTLRPLVLETDGLEAALQTMADKMRDLYQQNIVIEADPQVIEKLDPPRQTVIFYLVEESVNNARKHAEASEIHVQIRFVPNQPCIAVLEIADNGVGFDVQAVMKTYDRRGSLGMINLRERADLVNGLLKIDSVPGRGTTIRVYIPLTDEAADRLHQRR